MVQMRASRVGSDFKVAEFFAGMGLVRKAIEPAGFRVVFANDVDPVKHSLYQANFGAAEFQLGDVRDLRGSETPCVDLATASFPCTDFSLAGNREGLQGKQSSLLLEFLRILEEMKGQRPAAVLLENVPGFLTSNGGRDLRLAIESLNGLGYSCDILQIDARNFLPQSRQRLFIVAALDAAVPLESGVEISNIRPKSVCAFFAQNLDLRLHCAQLPKISPVSQGLESVVDRFNLGDPIWWPRKRLDSFLNSMSSIQAKRLDARRTSPKKSWATAFRRTRNGKPVWEVRPDNISGCLRTTRGGSSKQAIVEAGHRKVQARWMTAQEYARLQGAEDMTLDAVSESQARFALGDAICVPAVSWLAQQYLRRIMRVSRKV